MNSRPADLTRGTSFEVKHGVQPIIRQQPFDDLPLDISDRLTWNV